jgi:hypothetical protein
MDNYIKLYYKYKLKYLNLKSNLKYSTMHGGNPHGDAMKKIFPSKEGVEYDNLQMTKEGYYSATPPNDSLQIFKFMRTYLGTLDDKIITDLTGNVGGDTIAFALEFKHVYSIELNPENFTVLQNNVRVFNLDNVNLYQGDSLEIFPAKEPKVWDTDVLYIDAPWGGKEYKKIPIGKLELFLGKTNISNYLFNIIRGPNKPHWIFLKVPFNYNFDAIEGLVRNRGKKYYKQSITRQKNGSLEISYYIICIIP